MRKGTETFAKINISCASSDLPLKTVQKTSVCSWQAHVALC